MGQRVSAVRSAPLFLWRAKMKRLLMLLLISCLVLFACRGQGPLVYNVNKSAELKEYESELAAESLYAESVSQQSIEESRRAESEAAAQEALIWKKKKVSKKRVLVKGIYLTDNTAGSGRMDEIISHMDQTELNAVVIDIKNDHGRIASQLDAPLAKELGATVNTISDLPGLLSKLHEHGIYAIARLVTFRDPYLGGVKPEWMNQKADGSVFRDNSGMSWVNPYKREYWEYIAQIADACADSGFDEIQFDYVRFCTEKGMNEVVYSEEDTQGLDKTQIIMEFVRFISDRMAKKNVFMSADVFGTIIGSYVDTISVGQDYSLMATGVDYMSPMIYPSHYGNGNFGIAYPDMEPYKTIRGALAASRKDLQLDYSQGQYQASIRPWLQGFTASYLQHYINYGPQQIRQQIQAVYDSGYEEWLIWNAANNYDWNAFRSKEEGKREEESVAASQKAEQESRDAALLPSGSSGKESSSSP